MTSSQPRRTPIYERHVALGARMVPFAGWEMPVQYSGVIDEVRTVRTSAGLFDVSHMGELRVSGPGALAWLNLMTTNDVSRLKPGRAQYSLLLNETAGIVDDILVYWTGADEYLVVVNAGNADKDRAWLEGRLETGARLQDESDATALLAIQGPAAETLLQPLTSVSLSELRRFGFAAGTVGEPGGASTDCLISRTGYTGEDGFELFTQGDAAALWDLLLAAGGERIRPCGLGARDVLRIEAGNVLYGHEISEETDPLAAGLMWTVKTEKPSFVGRQPLAERVQAGPIRVIAGLTSASRAIPRQGYPVQKDGQSVGVVTSGTFSPTLNKPIGMGYLPPELAAPGMEVNVLIRERPERMVVTELPFYRATRR